MFRRHSRTKHTRNTGMTKTELRKLLKAAVKEIPPDIKNERAKEAIRKIETDNRFINAKTIMAFYPLPDEIDISPALQRWAKNKSLYLPAMENGLIVPRLYTRHLQAGTFGVLQPVNSPCPSSDLDLVIVPGLGFSTDGARLGRGKGCYDRFLAKTNATKIGLCYKEQLTDDIEIEEHDIFMDAVIWV